MVLIQGIDGSLRTPSSEEKLVIMDRVRPKKVARDYNSLLNRPLRYKLDAEKYPAQKKKYDITPKEEETTEGTQGEGEGENQESATN